MPRDSRHDSNRAQRSPPRRDYGNKYNSRNSDRDSQPYGYSERERELERNRDRHRYNDRTNRSTSPSNRKSSRSKSPEDKSKPNFKPSGLLAAETNTVKTTSGDKTVLKYNEPPEARKPLVGWRLYGFKGEEQTDLLHIHRQSAYLFGRDKFVCDVAIDHPSCSKQHAVIQYRSVKEKDEYGVMNSAIKPFIIDLESTNGTIVNGEQIPTSRYYELKKSDVIKFGQSTKEYVVLSEESS